MYTTVHTSFQSHETSVYTLMQMTEEIIISTYLDFHLVSPFPIKTTIETTRVISIVNSGQIISSKTAIDRTLATTELVSFTMNHDKIQNALLDFYCT